VSLESIIHHFWELLQSTKGTRRLGLKNKPYSAAQRMYIPMANEKSRLEGHFGVLAPEFMAFDLF
jgi:hypothetical protein